MDVGWASAVVSLVGAAVAVGSLVVTVVEGRRARRNTKFLAHHDHWGQRWSWIAERALSHDTASREAAALMARAIVTRTWTTADDRWVEAALREEGRRIEEQEAPARDHEGE